MSELNELNRKIRQMMDEITHYELDIKRLLATKAQLEEEIKQLDTLNQMRDDEITSMQSKLNRYDYAINWLKEQREAQKN